MEKEPYLREGMKHEAVIRVKQILQEQGYWKGPISSAFGPKLTKAVVYFQQTHLNKHGKPCGVDGEVGPETWWALKHPSGKAQRSNIIAPIPAGLSEARQKVLTVALSQHGAREKPPGSNRGPKIDKYLPKWWLKMPGPAWCCFYFSWVCKEALGCYPIGRREGSCTKASERAKEKGIWVPWNRAKGLVPGDAFVMLWTDKKGKCHGHIGFVLRASEDNTEFNTVEGNCGNRCKIGLREFDERVAGFIDVCGDREHVRLTPFGRGIIEAANVAHATTR